MKQDKVTSNTKLALKQDVSSNADEWERYSFFFTHNECGGIVERAHRKKIGQGGFEWIPCKKCGAKFVNIDIGVLITEAEPRAYQKK